MPHELCTPFCSKSRMMPEPIVPLPPVTITAFDAKDAAIALVMAG